MSLTATRFCEECFDERLEEDYETHRFMEPVVIPDLHSTFLVDVVRLLLEYGLNPNAVYDDTNIMSLLMYIDNESLAAGTLALLLEHGGNTDLVVDGVGLFSDIDFMVMFDSVEQYDRRTYDALVHCWLVYIGYGAKLQDGIEPVDIVGYCGMNREYELKDFELSDLKEHRNYTFGLSSVPNRGDNWSLQIFDR